MSSEPKSSDATATGTANAQPTMLPGKNDCRRNHNAAASDRPSTLSDPPAMMAAIPPTREGCPASDTLGAASKKRGAPQAAQRDSSPWSTIGARWPHFGQPEPGDELVTALA